MSRCFLCKCEDLPSEPQPPREELAAAGHAYNPSPGTVETRGYPWPATLFNQQPPDTVGTPVSENKV